jgi:hypothetical protein
MQNSLVIHLRGYVEAAFKDAAFAYRQKRDWERDKARLLHELDYHGSRVLTIDLPALAKHFDRCLDEHQYKSSKLALGRLSRTAEVPVFLRDLYLQVFDNEGMLMAEPSIAAVDTIRQLLIGCKKILLPCSQKGIANEVTNFIAVETDCRRSSLTWELDELQSERAIDLHFADFGYVHTVGSAGASYEEALLVQRVADTISTSFGDFSLEDPRELPKHGPGAVADFSKRKVSKYTFADWPAKLDHVFPFDLYGSTNLGMSRVNPQGLGQGLSYRNREVPSRLIVVPKDLTKPRLIAAEPSQHQWIQQLVWSQLEARIAKTVLAKVVSFRDQSQNQRFAIEGSRTGRFATIDLSAASDRLSCAVVERFFRTNTTILDRLHACRTRWIRIDIPGITKQHVMLKKFSPMGSAATFPVQSIVYAGVAIASVLITRGWKFTAANITKAAKMVTVFGDDIIVPTDCCRTSTRLLTWLGLKVNASKTYSTGRFRESCGVEAFMGYNVTPARLLLPTSRASNANLSSLLQTSNNFWDKGWWHTASWLETTFARYRELLPIVGADSLVPGLLSFCGPNADHLALRQKHELHRMEVKIMRLHSKTPLIKTDGHHHLFQYFTERPAPDLVTWESGIRGEPVADMRPGWVDIGNIMASSNATRAKVLSR